MNIGWAESKHMMWIPDKSIIQIPPVLLKLCHLNNIFYNFLGTKTNFKENILLNPYFALNMYYKCIFMLLFKFKIVSKIGGLLTWPNEDDQMNMTENLRLG